jgi:MarR family transcriptional regulator, 2-MHQ and catechol-resistance regulon repressor
MNREALIQEIVENMARCQRPANLSLWQKIGLSHAQMGILYMLLYHQNLQAKQISEYLGVSKSAVSQLIEPLVEKRYIERLPAPSDRRIVMLSLSAKGRQAMKRLSKYKFAGFRSRLESLPEKDLDQLAGLVRKLSQSSTNKK